MSAKDKRLLRAVSKALGARAITVAEARRLVLSGSQRAAARRLRASRGFVRYWRRLLPRRPRRTGPSPYAISSLDKRSRWLRKALADANLAPEDVRRYVRRHGIEVFLVPKLKCHIAVLRRRRRSLVVDAVTLEDPPRIVQLLMPRPERGRPRKADPRYIGLMAGLSGEPQLVRRIRPRR